MSEQQRAELREQARAVAAQAPPLTEEKKARLGALLMPAVQQTGIEPQREAA